MTAPGCVTSSAGTTPAQWSGQIPPADRRKTRRSSPRACSPATSISGRRRAGRCLNVSPGPMPSDLRCGRRSSTFRRPEASHGVDRPHHQHCPRPHQNRHGGPGLELPAPRLAPGAYRACLMQKPAHGAGSDTEISGSAPRRSGQSHAAPSASCRNQSVLRGVQLRDFLSTGF